MQKPKIVDYVGAIILGAVLGAMMAWGGRVIDFLN